MSVATPEQKAGWPAPNYVDPENRHGIVLGFTAPTLALVVIFTAVRFYGKGVLRQALGWDDWTMLAATISAVPVSVMAMASLNYGLGLHIWDQKPEWHETYSKMAFAADILFPISASATKISLCLTYLRLFPSRSDKIFCYVISVFVTLYTLACIFLMLFQCTPIRGYWDPTAVQSCINMRATLVAIAGLNSLSDFLVYLWPAKPLWSLQLPLKQRIGLILIFAVGATVCVAGSLRIYYLERYFTNYDLLWDASVVYAVMNLEVNLGIICGCLSGVKPVMAVIFPSLFGSSYKTNSRPTYPTYGRSTHHESFAFQPLSDASNISKKKLQHDIRVDNIDVKKNKEGTNFAWASASRDREAHENGGLQVPNNAIAVNSVVTIKEEERVETEPASLKSGKSGEGDGGSEEWIMEEFPAPGGKK